MRVLALEPYDGGSHKAFLDGWIGAGETASRHQWTRLGLPPSKWKWRMRHAALTFAEKVEALASEGGGWDVLFVTSMLDLAQFRGLAPPAVARLPAVLYFHENQLTYPVREERERDLHFAFTHLTSAAAADQVWFNSAFHRDEFLTALENLVRRLPDFQPRAVVEALRGKSRVEPPGIDPLPRRSSRGQTARRPGPLRLLWAARWEHDKDPETFFAALDELAVRLATHGVDFRLSVLGEHFRDVPPVFEQARRRHAERIDHWGFQPRSVYRQVLAEADILVSTAQHEFFGISVVEAVAAGVLPLVPRRLAYPDVLKGLEAAGEACFYETLEDLVDRLTQLARSAERGDEMPLSAEQLRASVARYFWPRRRAELDAAIARD